MNGNGKTSYFGCKINESYGYAGYILGKGYTL